HGSDDVFEKAIRNQVKIAIDEANIILFMVDVTTGITDLDEEVARMLRKTEKDVFVIVNKADNPNRLLAANEFYSLGFENTFFLSAISGSGTGEILDAIAERIEFQEETEEEETLPRFAIIGQPNVGKSSLTNALLGFERNIVTEIAGTTRDSIHSHYNQFGKEFLLIDTAGLRKKGKVHEDLEFYSVIRAIRAVEEADVCLLMIDAETGIEAQDMQIFQLAVRRRKGVVILVNKWDLVEKETNTAKEVEDRIKQKLAPFNDVPVVFISATEKTRIFKAIEVAMDVYERRNQKIRTPELNTWLEEVTTAHPPPSHRGKFVKIKYGNQLPLAYPAFAFFCNYPSAVKGSYKNYLENQLRKRYNFTGVPVAIYFREK
nr:ribosome biogenesis GTPase Der [Saprospiraceae bacterium]